MPTRGLVKINLSQWRGLPAKRLELKIRRQRVETNEYPPASAERLAMAGRSNSRTRNRRMMK
jgi:hypothetical protein